MDVRALQIIIIIKVYKWAITAANVLVDRPLLVFSGAAEGGKKKRRVEQLGGGGGGESS